ncbi:MAG: flagellar M-ring protein FliF [Clostridiales bacterium]|nr:flagellar M-ring protein FliF [Clostridiales bacterium]
MDITAYYSKITDYVKKIDKKKKKTYLFLLGFCLTTAVILAIILNRKNYIVLYRNLDITECAEIVSTLEEMGIPHKVKNENTILVRDKDEPSVKLQLASKGYPKSALNYDIFTQNINFMTTDFEKTQYSLYQLQERLAAAIETMSVVNDAIVTITLPDNRFTILDEDKIEPSASVLLKVMGGVSMTGQQIRGIEQLVAKSVPGLVAENISIINQDGIVLNNTEDETLSDAAGRFSAQKEISGLYAARIKSVLAPIYGDDGVSVGVNVILDFDTKIIESIDYSTEDGKTGIIGNFDQTYEGSAPTGQNGGVPGTDSNSEIPGYVTIDPSDTEGSVSSKVSIDYLVDYVKQQIQKQGAEIKDVTVSVLIDKSEMSEIESANLKSIVANTAGVDLDKVALYNMEFKKLDGGSVITPPENKSIIAELLESKYLPLLVVSVLAILLIVTLIILFVVIRKKNKAKKLLLAAKAAATEAGAGAEEEIKEIHINRDSREKQLANEIREFSLKSPEITAMLLRTLLKGDTE